MCRRESCQRGVEESYIIIGSHQRDIETHHYHDRDAELLRAPVQIAPKVLQLAN